MGDHFHIIRRSFGHVWNQLIYLLIKEFSLSKCIVELQVASCSTIHLHSRYNIAYLASFPTEVVIVSSIIIQCRRPVAADESGGVVAISEGLIKGIGKKSLLARKENAALKARVSDSYPNPQLLPY